MNDIHPPHIQSMEHFTTKKDDRKTRRPVYTLKDDSGEDVRGHWYPEELQAIGNNEYKIERVLKRRTAADGTREQFVKWLGWPEKFNSWIKETDIYDV